MFLGLFKKQVCQRESCGKTFYSRYAHTFCLHCEEVEEQKRVYKERLRSERDRYDRQEVEQMNTGEWDGK